MAAYKTGAFVRSKYYTPFYKTPLKWIPHSKSGASKSQPRSAAHTHIGNVWEYPPPLPPPREKNPLVLHHSFFLKNIDDTTSFKINE